MRADVKDKASEFTSFYLNLGLFSETRDEKDGLDPRKECNDTSVNQENGKDELLTEN